MVVYIIRKTQTRPCPPEGEKKRRGLTGPVP